MTRVPTKRSTKNPKKLRVGDNKNSLKNNKDIRKQQVRKQQQLLKLRKQQEQARREKSLNERLAKLT